MHILNRMSVIAFMAADEGNSNGGTDGTEPAVTENQKPTKLVMLTDQEKIDALGKVLPSHKEYDSYAEAEAAIQKLAPSTENFYGLAIAVAGLNDDGTGIDPAAYEGMRVRVGTLASRVEINGKAKNAIKAITVLPIPTIEAIMATGEGKAFLDKVIAKELSHVAYRNIRDAVTDMDLLAGMAKSPRSVADYLAESKRAGSAGDTETFDALWAGLRQAVKESVPALYKVLPPKGDVIKSIRSKAYALANYEPLENAKQGSIFVGLAQAAIATAAKNTTKDGQPQPLDSSAITDWLAERETLVLGKTEEKDYSAVDEIDFANFGGAAA
jgi:hypothetical protein